MYFSSHVNVGFRQILDPNRSRKLFEGLSVLNLDGKTTSLFVFLLAQQDKNIFIDT